MPSSLPRRVTRAFVKSAALGPPPWGTPPTLSLSLLGSVPLSGNQSAPGLLLGGMSLAGVRPRCRDASVIVIASTLRSSGTIGPTGASSFRLFRPSATGRPLRLVFTPAASRHSCLRISSASLLFHRSRHLCPLGSAAVPRSVSGARLPYISPMAFASVIPDLTQRHIASHKSRSTRIGAQPITALQRTRYARR